MRTAKTILLGTSVPLAMVLAGFGSTAQANEIATPAAVIPIGGVSCANVLCPGGTACIDTKNGPQCVPLPPPLPGPK